MRDNQRKKWLKQRNKRLHEEAQRISRRQKMNIPTPYWERAK